MISEETRRQRRNLDIVAAVALLVVFLDLVPERISALGVSFGETSQERFLWALLAFDIAFLAFFAVYASNDISRRFSLIQELSEENVALERAQGDRMIHCEELLVRARSDVVNEVAISQELEGTVDRLARDLRHTHRNRMLQSIGTIRAVVEFGVPLALSVGAAAALRNPVVG